MPQPRRLDPDDHAAASAWLAAHGFEALTPADAIDTLNNDAWRALKAAVRSARRGRQGSTPSGLFGDMRDTDHAEQLRVLALEVAGLAASLEADRRKGHLSGDVAQSLRSIQARLGQLAGP